MTSLHLYRSLFICTLAMGVIPVSHAALKFNEILFDPIFDTGDLGNEFIEIIGDPGESTANVWLLAIDNGGGDVGQIDIAMDLTAAGATGSNGLLLLRDTAAVLTPAPDTSTTLHIVSTFGPSQIPNQAYTYMLVTSTVNLTSTMTNDFDSGNDGTLDSIPWDGVVLDAVYVRFLSGPPNIAAGFGGVVSTLPSFTPMYAFRDPVDQSWETARVTGSSGGPFTLSGTNVTDGNFALTTVTPGSANSTPTPVTISGYSID